MSTIIIKPELFKASGLISQNGAEFVFPGRQGRLTAEFERGSFIGVKAEGELFICADVTVNSDFSCALNFDFGAADGGYIGFKMGLLPHLKTRLAIPMSALGGNTLFLPRTPGKLKTVTQGAPLKLSELNCFTITVPNAPAEVPLTLHSVFISEGEPEYPLESKPMVDILGQKTACGWPGKTSSEAEMCDFLRRESEIPAPDAFPNRSSYGGSLDKRFDATGFFGIENDGRRVWLRDPDGYAFFSIGLDCVTIDGDCNLSGIESLTTALPPRGSVGWSGRGKSDCYFSWHKANLYRAFGEKWYDSWCALTRRRMKEWGFNTVACWSDPNYIKTADTPYVFIFSGYPQTENRIFRDFPDVFSPEFETSAQNWSRQLDALRCDRNLIGYFMSNEPQWAFVNNIDLAAMMLSGEKDFESRRALIAYLREKYGDAAALAKAWECDISEWDELLKPIDTSKLNTAARSDTHEFTGRMIERYIRIPALAAKSADGNHLNLGIRYAWLSSELLSRGSEYFDVYSFNCYSMCPTEAIEQTLKLINKPLIIGEFHFGALDRGLDATGIRGVTSQAERAVAYRRYMHAAAAHPMCVGAHYFTLNDQAYLGRFDGENYQIGLVDVCNRPYSDFTDGIITVNSELYDVANSKIPPSHHLAAEIPAIFF